MLVSYAQNGEDVVLSRLFLDHRGFYVDVGAGHPLRDSTTKIFCDRGWRGVNIEPHPGLFSKLRLSRPRDRNLCCAIGDTGGIQDLHVYPGRWGWSTVNSEVIERHREKGLRASIVRVEVRQLETVLREVQPPRIDFLKVDVEGSESAVLRSVDLSRWAPRVIVMEATLPGEPTPSHEEWESLLSAHSYTMTLFDGLNRFYVSESDADAQEKLSVPANVFDNYIPARWLQLTQRPARQRLLSYSGPGQP